MAKLKKYKVEFIQSETFIVDILALNEEQAVRYAEDKFSNGDYHVTGDCRVETGTVYDVSNTDDPFNP